MTTTTRKTARGAAAALGQCQRLVVGLALGLVLGLGLAGAAGAQDLTLPAGAVSTRDLVQDPGAFALPVGRWQREGGVPVARIEGRVQVQAYRIDGTTLTPLQILLPLRDQLQAQGFEIVLDCAARTCGGFDFRFETFVLPAPQMAVDLTNYHALSLRDPQGNGVALLASRAGTSGYLQIVRAGLRGGQTTGAALAPLTVPAAGHGATGAADAGALGDLLETRGHVVLPGLVFETGSASLTSGEIASLEDLARFLLARPELRVVLVGHTDATGSLDGNIALSRRRAQAAVDYLISRHGIEAGRVSAEGAGYLAPVASNLSAEGRERNRRVEAVLLP